MGLFSNLFGSNQNNTKAKMDAAKAKKAAITTNCENQHKAVDAEIDEASKEEASNDRASNDGASKEELPADISRVVQPVNTQIPVIGGKSCKRKFSKKRKGGKKNTHKKRKRNTYRK